MPNWVSIRLTLSGPHAEIMRFQNTCIRAVPEDSDERTLDLGALVPMPAAIVATLEDPSAATKQAALTATGYEDWYDWRLDHWGCKWNTSNFHVITAAPDLFDVSFDTPWSAPEPALAALAVQFPLLSGRVCAIEESMDWGLIGEFKAGSYTRTLFEAAAELNFLVYDWRLNGHLRLNTGLVLAEPSSDMQKPGNGVLERIWASLEAMLAPELMARMCFEIDVQRFNQRHDSEHTMSGDHARVFQLQDVMHNPLNLDFLLTEGRCYHSLDRKLMALLAEGLTGEWGQSPDATQIDNNLRRELAYLLLELDEDELLDWAFHASLRQHSGMNFADPTSLQNSFVAYAKVMREQILLHLDSVQTSIMRRGTEQAGLEHAACPLSSCSMLS